MTGTFPIAPFGTARKEAAAKNIFPIAPFGTARKEAEAKAKNRN